MVANFEVIVLHFMPFFGGINIRARFALKWFLDVKSTEVLTLYFYFASQFMKRKWVITVIIQFLPDIVDIVDIIFGLPSQFSNSKSNIMVRVIARFWRAFWWLFNAIYTFGSASGINCTGSHKWKVADSKYL